MTIGFGNLEAIGELTENSFRGVGAAQENGSGTSKDSDYRKLMQETALKRRGMDNSPPECPGI